MGLDVLPQSIHGLGLDFPRQLLSLTAEEDIRNRLRMKPFSRRPAKILAATSKKTDSNVEENINGTPVEGLQNSSTNKLKNKAKKTTKKGSTKDESKIKAISSSVSSKPVNGTSKKKESTIEDNVNGIPMEVLTSSSMNRSKKKAEKFIKKGNTIDEISNNAGVKQDSNETHPKQQFISADRSLQKGQQTFKLYPPSGKSVVVVESVTKSKVIQGYLGDMYEVLPSYGHVRDLAARSGSVRPEDDFSMLWEVPSAAWTHLKSIKVALSGATNLILASDPDREGEAIAWHIIEMLQQQNALHPGIRVARVVFHEITEASIKNSLQAPRDIDINLVNAYLGRRALDYLIGFNISPLLWRKLPGCQSAGRVQSAALSLICDREMEIDQFESQEYWTVDAVFGNVKSPSSRSGVYFTSHLAQIDSKRLGQLSISSEKEAKDIEQKLISSTFEVLSSKRSQTRKNPLAPYITSTLQQESANKLHFPATYTMKLAQKLYEGVQLADGKSTGLITYTRTDGLHISDEAIKDIRSLIAKRYGPGYASDGPRKYFKKVKNAQEAHEAIRPTDINRLPSLLVGTLDEDALKLYTLIWLRTLACQMEPAVIDQIQIDIGSSDGYSIFRASCSKIGFLGYQAVHQDVEAAAVSVHENEGIDKDAAFGALNILKAGDRVYISEVKPKQHHTIPPPRYSEGSLVKKLEELGIGRPSTYASTINVLQARSYIAIKSRVLYPEFRGRMVSAFIANHFAEVADYSFTADMETELDNVSAGMTEWKGLLKDYWTRFSKYCNLASNVTIHQVEKMLEDKFGDYLFASLPNRSCPSCLNGTLIFKVSKFGAGYFIGCNQHPRCKYIAKTLYGDDDDNDGTEVDPQRQTTVEEPKLIGMHPSTGEKVLLKVGPYGHYIQLGEDKKSRSPQRASAGHIKDVTSLSLGQALDLLSYPKTLGLHPEDRRPVIIKIARAGFAVKHGKTMAPVPKALEPSNVTLEKAMKILLGPEARHVGRPKSKAKA
uniref:DNA topoisomerase n=1 Tax=Kalanchoe fedtschenkoi TaxID=63787 RepID=A0A7N0VE90_KALFE